MTEKWSWDVIEIDNHRWEVFDDGDICLEYFNDTLCFSLNELEKVVEFHKQHLRDREQ